MGLAGLDWTGADVADPPVFAVTEFPAGPVGIADLKNGRI